MPTKCPATDDSDSEVDVVTGSDNSHGDHEEEAEDDRISQSDEDPEEDRYHMYFAYHVFLTMLCCPKNFAIGGCAGIDRQLCAYIQPIPPAGNI